jgi:hypothetical protein
MEIFRKHGGNTLRFFCTGQYGDVAGRRHWHLILLFKKPFAMPRMAKREVWRHWPHGWMTSENLTANRILEKVQYCVRYIARQVGYGDSPRVRCSANLGVSWVCELARRSAANKLLLVPQYHLPGVIWEQGPRVGQHRVFWMSGAMRKQAILAWKLEWARLYGEASRTPSSDWLRRYDPDHVDYVDPREQVQLGVLRQQAASIDPPSAIEEWERQKPKKPYEAKVGKYRLEGKSVHGNWGVYLCVDIRGQLSFYSVNPKAARAIEGMSVSEFFDVSVDAKITDDDLRLADAWVAAVRGPDWRPGIHGEEKAARERRKYQRRYAAAILVTEREEAQRRKYGTYRAGTGVYARSYCPKARLAAFSISECNCGACQEARNRARKIAVQESGASGADDQGRWAHEAYRGAAE